ncbi:sperm surface protein Sp17 [Aptenodytes patagonicus]|uniref:sperm surface protein Sp17 n=1 Tax=Aptenodytes patagonicus TaxID=9234 RepID=UPI003FA1189F
MSTPSSSTTLRLPAGFRNLLEGLALEVLRAQPTDVVAFAAQHFQTLLEQRKTSPADPAAWGARPEDQLLTQPPFQEPEEDGEKEDEEKAEDEAREQAGSVASTDTVRDAAPAPKTRLSEPKPATGAADGTRHRRHAMIPPQKSSP